MIKHLNKIIILLVISFSFIGLSKNLQAQECRDLSDKIIPCPKESGVSVSPNKDTLPGDQQVDKNTGLAPYRPLAPIPGIKLDSTGAAVELDLPSYIRVLVRIAIGVIGILSVVMIIIGGVQYMSTDAFSGKEDGKERVTKALGGLLLAVVAVFILRTINPQLITLQITDSEFNAGVGVEAENLGIPEELQATKEDIAAFNNSNSSGELVVRDLNVSISNTIKNEYIPALEKALPSVDKKTKTLLIAHTMSEGFKAGTMAYRTNNPGNIGNVGKKSERRTAS